MYRIISIALVACMCVSSAFAASVKGQGNYSNRCANAVVTETRLVGRVNVTTYGCPGGFDTITPPIGARAPAPLRSESASTSSLGRSLESRQLNVCTHPFPVCQSVIPCQYEYYNINPASVPTLADCQELVSEVQGFNGTFTVYPQSWTSVLYGTCQFVWGNKHTNDQGPLEYSFYNWMVVGMTLFNGLVTPARQYAGAGCVPASLEWFIETVHPNNVF